VSTSTSNPDLSPDGEGVFDRLNRFLRLVEQYTHRELSYDSGALNAFSGIMQSLQETAPRILNVAGLPFVPFVIDEAKTKEKYMFLALSWYHYRWDRRPIRRPAFPSWSWAGWESPALCHHFERENDAVGDFPLIQDVHLASEDSIASIHSDVSQDFLSKVTVIQFSANVIPAEDFLTKGSALLDEATTWDGLRIYGADLYTESRLSETPKEYQNNIQRAVWSCLLLGFYGKDAVLDWDTQAFLLTVE
jgi:hypothetical protein